MARTARALVTAVVAGGLLTGCGVLPDGASPAPTSTGGASTPTVGVVPDGSPEPTSPAPTDAVPPADAVRADGTVLAVGPTTVVHALAVGAAVLGAPVAADPDVSVLTAAPGPSGTPGGTPAGIVLAAPPGATLGVQDDGSFVVLGADGTFLGGGARPATVEDGGAVTITPAGDDRVLVSAADGVLEVRVAARALAGTDWGEREGGRSLAVSPTPWARTAGQAGEVGVWTELVAAVPEAGTQVMRDQLTCHVLGAPEKETWNLEPWRPDVGLLGVLAAACNPT